MGAGLVVLALGGGVFAVLRHSPPPVEAAAPVSPTTTVEVERTDLTDDRQLAGTLGFGHARTVKGTGPGIVTKLPAAGAVAGRGSTLYRVDDQPVVVFYGPTPLFRPIDQPGLEGSDVLEVRRNLRALGYRIPRTDHADVADAGLLAAIKRWQVKLGVPDAGVLKPQRVVVLTGAGRVSAVTAALGDPADGPLLAVTSTTRLVSVPMGASEVGPIRAGTRVTVTFPDAEQVPGEVTAVSRTVSPENEGDQPKVTVIVTPDKPVTAYDSAPVQVRFTTVSRPGVLAVPVGALVALREGGYAVQRPDGTLLPVTTGLFARGMVEVSGVAEGTTVVTTS
ncbi:efflux RND transporter periplasmic adaptor subunit [Actinoplanes sp. CA-054009]